MSIKSQLSAMSGVEVKTVQPQAQFSRFVLADIKGGETAHQFRMSMVATAILESFKGNYRVMAEAATLCTGKGKKARSYKAGFEAVGAIAKLPYAGKWDAATNAAVREQAHALSKKLEFEFEAAFLTVFQAPAEKAPSDKPSAKERAEQAETALAEAQEALAAERAKATPMTVEADRAVVDIAEAVEAVTQALQHGLLDSAELEMLRVALSLAGDTATDTAGAPLTGAEIAAMGANSPLLQAQAA